MIQLKDRRLVPSNGYTYQIPDGPLLKGPTLGHLAKVVWEYKKANNLPTPPRHLMGLEVEAQICQNQPDLCFDPHTPSPPTIVESAANLAVAMKDWAKAGFPTVTPEQFQERKRICLACNYFRGWKDAEIGTCKKCNCPVGKISVKLKLATTSCPDGRWSAIKP